MEADAGAGLEHIDHELVVPIAVGDFLSGLGDSVGTPGIYQLQRLVGLSRRPLYHADNANQRGMRVHPRDGIVLPSAFSLNAVIKVGGDFLCAQGKFFLVGGWVGAWSAP